jgi:hypothetical protein
MLRSAHIENATVAINFISIAFVNEYMVGIKASPFYYFVLAENSISFQKC